MKDLAWLSRSELLIGTQNIEKLQNSHVLIVGLGGVGSFAAEFICRAGVGESHQPKPSTSGIIYHPWCAQSPMDGGEAIGDQSGIEIACDSGFSYT